MKNTKHNIKTTIELAAEQWTRLVIEQIKWKRAQSSTKTASPEKKKV